MCVVCSLQIDEQALAEKEAEITQLREQLRQSERVRAEKDAEIAELREQLADV